MFTLAPLAELAGGPTMNVSLRGRAAPGRPLIAGFVVTGASGADDGTRPPLSGATQRDILIRAVGPGLVAFGVTETWSDPAFQIFSGARPGNFSEYVHADWSALPGIWNTPAGQAAVAAGFRKIFDYVGAFPLPAGSKDAAAVVRLAPGAYTLVCEPVAGDAGGEVLIEIYFMP